MTRIFWSRVSAALLVIMILSSQSNLFGQSDTWVQYLPPKDIDCGKSVVLISGDEEYRSEEAMPMLGMLLSQRFGMKCTVLFPIDPETGRINPNIQTNIPGMEQLDSADLVIIGLRFRQLPDAQMKHFVDYLNSGRPIIGLRTSTHAFRYDNESKSEYRKFGFDSNEYPGGFGKQILGETWISHHGNHGSQSTRGIVVEANKAHPILAGVADVWGPTDVYGVKKLPDDSVVLLDGQVLAGMEQDSEAVDGKPNEPMMPLLWCRELDVEGADQSQRIVCTTMGAASDFVAPGLRRVMVNSAFWSMRMEDKIDPDAMIEFVQDFKPSNFGFNGFKKNMSVSDFLLKPATNKQE